MKKESNVGSYGKFDICYIERGSFFSHSHFGYEKHTLGGKEDFGSKRNVQLLPILVTFYSYYAALDLFFKLSGYFPSYLPIFTPFHLFLLLFANFKDL